VISAVGLPNFLHRAYSGSRQAAAFASEMFYDFFYKLAEFGIDKRWVIAVNTGNQIRTFADIHLVFFTPLNPFVIIVRIFHLFILSIAC